MLYDVQRLLVVGHSENRVHGCFAGADSTVAFGFVDDAIVCHYENRLRGCYAGADSTVAFGFVDDAIVWLRRCVL